MKMLNLTFWKLPEFWVFDLGLRSVLSFSLMGLGLAAIGGLMVSDCFV